MQPIIVVTGLPRSGTSLMMQMLGAGGIPLVHDNSRPADQNNPRGYFEDKRTFSLDHDCSFIAACGGMAIKIVTNRVLDLPPLYRYKVIFMIRRIEEIVASQQKMIEILRQPTEQIDPDRIASALIAHLTSTLNNLESYPSVEVYKADYNRILLDPIPAINGLNAFLGTTMPIPDIIAVIDHSLYRQRIDDEEISHLIDDEDPEDPEFVRRRLRSLGYC